MKIANMNTGHSILAAALFICWAMLLSARTIAGMIYNNRPGSSYDYGLTQIGWILPACAWACFAAAVAVVLASCKKPS